MGWGWSGQEGSETLRKSIPKFREGGQTHRPGWREEYGLPSGFESGSLGEGNQSGKVTSSVPNFLSLIGLRRHLWTEVQREGISMGRGGTSGITENRSRTYLMIQMFTAVQTSGQEHSIHGNQSFMT
jgi:hypothetical protein